MTDSNQSLLLATCHRNINFSLIRSLRSLNRQKLHLVAGDYNFDILHYNDYAQTQEFVDNLFSHMLFSLITKPTRITANSATLIDNIFTNHLTADICNRIIINDISDHLPIFAHVFDRNFKVNDTSTKILKREINKTTLAHFLESLSETNWSSYFINNDPNGSYDSFVTEFSWLYDICFPLKILNLKRKRPNAPWLTNGLLKSIMKKNQLYKKLIQKPTQLRERQYKIYRNKLNHLIRNAKRLYYENKFERAKTDLKEKTEKTTEKTLLSLYHTLVYPYISYCSTVWTSTYSTNLNRIYLLQKRAVRAITKSDYLAHSAQLFSRLNVLDIYQVNSFHVGKFMYINTKTVCFHPFFLIYFKLTAKSIITILGLPPVLVLTNVEPILINLLSFFKVLRYGMLSLPH